MISQGKIIDSNGVDVFFPRQTEDEFLTSSYGTNSEESIINGNYHSYDISSVTINASEFSARALYIDGKLSSISLYPNKSFSWRNWSEQNELKKKEILNDFLTHELGAPPYKYMWGSVESIFDRKSGFSYVLIKYNE
jgi:hypothetical protein